MNILFYTFCELSPVKGGTERTTITTAHSLRRLMGAKCFAAHQMPQTGDMPHPDGFEAFYTIDRHKVEKQFAEIISKHGIDIIFNQGEFSLCSAIRRAIVSSGCPCKLITTFHFNPGPSLHSKFKNMLRTAFKEGLTIKSATKLLGWPVWYVMDDNRSRRWAREAVNCSDKFVLLSERFKLPYLKHAELADTEKITALPNALSFTDYFDMAGYCRKEQEVLIVARLEEVQKRISLALEIWRQIEAMPELEGWRLTIAGSGSDEETYRRATKRLGLRRVHFEGRQNPQPYYRRASIFMMTSAFEGWGLTLTEAQQYGCVPMAFNSYESLPDIIDDGQNGIIVDWPDTRQYASKLASLMADNGLRRQMAAKAIETSHRFEAEKVGRMWVELINKTK